MLVPRLAGGEDASVAIDEAASLSEQFATPRTVTRGLKQRSDDGAALDTQPPPMPDRALLTIGHGTLGSGELRDLLLTARVSVLVDVRRFPASRRQPHFAAEALDPWMGAAGIEYRWDVRLGGRRHLPKGVVSLDPWWTVAAFRAYAAHTRTVEFQAGLAHLLRDAGRVRVAVMCSETLWWRCHRRLIADVALGQAGRPVQHLMPQGATTQHQMSRGARLGAEGLLVWDGDAGTATGTSAPGR
jgi:hypothetical protein